MKAARTGTAITTVALALVMLLIGTIKAHADPRSAATPISNLRDGQAVTVTLSGYLPNEQRLGGTECGALYKSPADALTDCDLKGIVVRSADRRGDLTFSYTVHLGQIGSNPASMCKAGSTDCLLVVGSAAVPHLIRISFAGSRPGSYVSAGWIVVIAVGAVVFLAATVLLVRRQKKTRADA